MIEECARINFPSIRDLITYAKNSFTADGRITQLRNPSMIEKLNTSDITRPILDHEVARVISHHDADGITAAGIVCHTLMRLGKRFHATIVSQLDHGVVERLNEERGDGHGDADDADGALTIFCDMGSGHPDVISEVAGDVVVIDHHTPVGDLSCPHVNPHLVGIDGAFELSASGTAYAIAKELSSANVDLCGLAIAGAIGDKQLMTGANADILNDGVQNGVITVKKGIRIGDGDVADLLERNIEIYLDFTGDRAKVDDFLKEIGVSGRLGKLADPELRKLATALTLRLLAKGSPDAIETIIGDVYLLHREVIRNVDDFVSALHACARLNETGLALSLCLRDRTGIAHATKASVDYQRTLVKDMRLARPGIMHKDHITYIRLHDAEATGIIASTVTRFLHPDNP
ncbi:MAG: DHH family phosphoesterase, partial [Methanosarcinales archaeon]|nr:DHH family phosphoesterase [Methanosarcinales archaeon]